MFPPRVRFLHVLLLSVLPAQNTYTPPFAIIAFVFEGRVRVPALVALFTVGRVGLAVTRVAWPVEKNNPCVVAHGAGREVVAFRKNLASRHENIAGGHDARRGDFARLANALHPLGKVRPREPQLSRLKVALATRLAPLDNRVFRGKGHGKVVEVQALDLEQPPVGPVEVLGLLRAAPVCVVHLNEKLLCTAKGMGVDLIRLVPVPLFHRALGAGRPPKHDDLLPARPARAHDLKLGVGQLLAHPELAGVVPDALAASPACLGAFVCKVRPQHRPPLQNDLASARVAFKRPLALLRVARKQRRVVRHGARVRYPHRGEMTTTLPARPAVRAQRRQSLAYRLRGVEKAHFETHESGRAGGGVILHSAQ